MDGSKGHPKMTAGGQIAESWGLSDDLGLMRQIGAIPEPGQEAGAYTVSGWGQLVGGGRLALGPSSSCPYSPECLVLLR